MTRWRLAVAKGLRENCRDVGRAASDRAKNTHCELSSFGPALFEIWWPDIYLGGPYGPDQMYWPELVRRSEKCAGPAGQCLCRGLFYKTSKIFFTFYKSVKNSHSYDLVKL